MSSIARAHDLTAVLEAAHRAHGTNVSERTARDDYGNTITSITAADGTVLLEKQPVIGGWNIAYRLPDGGYQSTTRGEFADDVADTEWIDAAWAEVQRIIAAGGSSSVN